MAVCNTGTCGVACVGGGYHACGATTSPCYSDSSTTRCGSSCIDCTQPNANPTCIAGACANTCIGGSQNTLVCAGTGGKPNCSLWDFESNTAEGWAFDVATAMGTGNDAHVGVVMASSAQAVAGGTRSMAVGFNGPSQGTWVVYVKVPLCANGQALDLRNKTLTFHVKMVTAMFRVPLVIESRQWLSTGQSGPAITGAFASRDATE